ncbi:hypothetical protein ACIHCQ_19165 [Streptomyces sp. NPDC052236]|uniref:hypothetical protein n=1 Tax=Streptomyces sp. NPDC052236 TaxID=3365686 RepID=UPI0037D493A7
MHREPDGRGVRTDLTPVDRPPQHGTVLRHHWETAEPPAAGHAPAEAIDLILEAIAERARARLSRIAVHERAAEYSAAHPVRGLVTTHRNRIRTLFGELPTRLGHAEAESAAGALLKLYDGAMAAGHPDDSTAAHKTLLDAVRLIRSGS